jgi:hypothetical protein
LIARSIQDLDAVEAGQDSQTRVVDYRRLGDKQTIVKSLHGHAPFFEWVEIGQQSPDRETIIFTL